MQIRNKIRPVETQGVPYWLQKKKGRAQSKSQRSGKGPGEKGETIDKEGQKEEHRGNKSSI